MTVHFEKISTWRERIGKAMDFPLHSPTEVERAMVAEIADLRAVSAIVAAGHQTQTRAVVALAWEWQAAAVASGFASSDPAQELFALLGWPDHAATTADGERDTSI